MLSRCRSDARWASIRTSRTVVPLYRTRRGRPVTTSWAGRRAGCRGPGVAAQGTGGRDRAACGGLRRQGGAKGSGKQQAPPAGPGRLLLYGGGRGGGGRG